MQEGEPARQRSWHIFYIGDVLPAPDGSFYVSVLNGGTHCSYILKVDSTGIVHKFAGQQEYGTSGYSGDGGPALEASFAGTGSHMGMAMDLEGYLYVADPNNHVVRKIGPAFGSAHPMVNAGEIMIPECADCPDYGGTGHVFNTGGRHLRTIDLATGQMIYEFLYDTAKRLIGHR